MNYIKEFINDNPLDILKNAILKRDLIISKIIKSLLEEVNIQNYSGHSIDSDNDNLAIFLKIEQPSDELLKVKKLLIKRGSEYNNEINSLIVLPKELNFIKELAVDGLEISTIIVSTMEKPPSNIRNYYLRIRNISLVKFIEYAFDNIKEV